MENKKLTQKQEIPSITGDALIHVVEPNNLSQGPDGSSFKFKAANLSMAGQDNIDIRKYVTIQPSDTTNDILAKINLLPAYEVNEKQSVWFITRQRFSVLIPPTGPVITPAGPIETFTLQRVLKYKMLNKGKGIYGSGGIALSLTDLELVYANTENEGDIESDPTTDIINYGNLTTQNISQWLNSSDPALVIQPQGDGYTIFKGTLNGVAQSYLWVGVGGVYGVGESTSTINDFQALSSTPPTGLDQNNILAWYNFGAMLGEGYITPANVADWLNSQPYSISLSEKSTPVVFNFTRYVGNVNTNFVFLFSRGKGIWGKANGAVTDITKWFYASNIKPLPPAPVTIQDIENDPNAVFHDLGTINDGNYLDVANTLNTWDLTDSGEGEPGQTITHYFTYIENGTTKILRFKGVAGTYGYEATEFVESDFAPVTNSNVAPLITNTSQLINDGSDGVNSFTSIANYGLPLTKLAQGYDNINETGNSGDSLMVNDWCFGQVSPSQYVKLARYIGPDPLSYESYEIIETLDF